MSNYKHYTLDDWIQCINMKLEYFDELDGNEMRDLVEFLSGLPRWIPIKTRPLTEEEQEHYVSMGWSDDSIDYIYNCPLPDDGQEVLITDRRGHVELDTFYSDDGCYFEYNYDADEVLAWMPLPQPYKAESEDKE